MSSQPTKTTLASAEPDLAPIRKQALEAVKVMFQRAVKHYPDSLDISDNKEDVENTTLSASGPLQDCEFGMVLLLVRDWLGDELFDSSEISSEKFEWVIRLLVENTITRVLKPNLKNEGGGGKQHSAFFTGEPYTQHSRGKKYSANLDAAMIVLAFLTLAVKHFDEPLSTAEHSLQPKDVSVPEWVGSWRDAALFVIMDGLRYAKECRVIPKDRFQGFTSDPDSNRERPADGYLEKHVDRLFFTWTACETINDMIGWRAEYFAKPLSIELPGQVITELNELIDDLQKTLHQAAEWCAEAFLEQFEALTLEDPSELVGEIGQLGKDGVPSAVQQDSIDLLEPMVQNVYHLSQYAAIRSLVPQSVSLEEVQTISDKLDVLVKQSIIGSGLDDAPHPKLSSTLTRQYNLGKSNIDPYIDDAWYPLVMRSLSGLLSRTLADIGTRFSRPKVLELTATFQRTLQEHFRNLIKRRPTGGANGPDGKLWSFVSGKPYVLYATQRTVFALMKYEEFLIKVDEFQKARPTDDDVEEQDLSLILARKLAETYFRPIITEMLSQIPRSEGGELLVPHNTGHDVALPMEPWAANVMRAWLARFTASFEGSQVKSNLSEKAEWLNAIRECAERYQPTKGLAERKKKGVDENLPKLKDEYKKICSFEEVGKELSQMPQWGVAELTPILFEYLFENCVQKSASSIEELSKNSAELWKLIKDAMDTRNTIKNLDPTGVP